MKTLRLNNRATMPALGLGTWKSAPGAVHEAVKTAIAAGYRHIDCASIYGNEVEIGQALDEIFANGVARREELWITSKLWNDGHAPHDVEPALQETLTNLGLDYLDLYLVHWPIALRRGVLLPSSGSDFLSLDEVPLTATWQAMEGLADTGLCHSIGVSNFSVPKLQALLSSARIPPAINQIELHPYLQQSQMLAFCQQEDIALTAYSPLGSGDRPARLKADDEPVLLDDPTVGRVAAKQGVAPAQVLIAWALERGTAVIPKSVNPGRIRQNLAAAAIALDADDMAQLATLDRHRRYVDGTLWAQDGSPYTVTSLWDE